ncbi:hypothetical protein J2S43_002695 [Catenuloplanes nepalensis]|uniref:Uncharacterized protein n=1 Tax=Catenuloplanes nepalensis TaxID=587533 RepID=A0ABT9MRX7_9ACTN|nr:hypothetical protein [Catenuloplanes nepalensis]MDP9794183.1 hypothetical protein [Catenuloplanes nepalensis]
MTRTITIGRDDATDYVAPIDDIAGLLLAMTTTPTLGQANAMSGRASRKPDETEPATTHAGT